MRSWPCLEEGLIFVPSLQDRHFLRRKRVSAEKKFPVSLLFSQAFPVNALPRGPAWSPGAPRSNFLGVTSLHVSAAVGRFVARGQGQGMGGWGEPLERRDELLWDTVGQKVLRYQLPSV